MDKVLRRFFVSAVALGLAAVSSSSSADPDTARVGRAAAYKHLHAESLEQVSSPEVIRSMFKRNTDGSVGLAAAPTRVWQVLEHGEKVECLSCIPLVSTLLYTSHDKTREIAAWWLRRRIFGVFGPGEIYSQVVATLGDPTQSENRRAYAANALGEFLTHSGAKHLASAIRNDASPVVREASVRALQRMNSLGPNNELSYAMSDSDASVRLAAVRASTRINAFRDLASVVALVGDGSVDVRRAAALAIGTMRAGDAVDGLIELTSPSEERDASVRKASVWALGQIADPSARSAVESALGDPDGFVRDAARVALDRL
jgi:HEAT repeat protein